MQCPYFTVVNYGAFDSSLVPLKKAAQSERLVTNYEFEFYTEDSPADSVSTAGVIQPKKAVLPAPSLGR